MGGSFRILAVILTILLANSCRRVRVAKEDDARLVAEWLESACDDGAGYAALKARVKGRGAAIEDLFRDAFRRGPAPELRDSALRSAERDWMLIQLQLAEPAAYGLSAEEIAWMKSTSLADRKRRETERLDYVYRVGALAALGITKGPIAQEVFKEILAAGNSPFQWVAQQFVVR